MTINCLTVDDEPLALELVSGYVEKTPFLQLSGKCSSAQEALQRLQETPVDVIFLDVQMPDVTGITFTRALEKGPRIIFTTAFEQYALEGYKLDVLDYLLKPFSYEEFLKTAYKAKEYAELLEKAASHNRTTTVHQDHLFVKAEYKLIRVNFNEILYIEGLKDYVKIYTTASDRPILSLLSLKSLEEKLSAHQFMRVHRSFIVSLSQVTTISNHRIIFGNQYIPVSTQYKDDFYQYIERRTV